MRPVISAAVMSHPARLDGARQVQQRLAPLTSALVTDPDPDGPPATVRTARLAYAAADDAATHHLVVQDDVWVPDGFAAAASDAIAAQPEAATSLFVEWGSRTAALVRLAALTGASWVPNLNPYVPTQALVLPAAVAREFARFLASDVPLREPDDEAALRFLRRAGVPTLVSVPNLVDHLDLPSLTGNGEHGVRRAACLAPEPSPSVGATVLDPPEQLPFLAWTTGISVILTVIDSEIVDRRPTREVLAEVLADVPAEVPAEADHGFEVWITAVATGRLLRQQWPAVAAALPERLADPLVNRAWQTMAPGGLRLVVDPGTLADQAAGLHEVTRHGLRYGVETGSLADCC